MADNARMADNVGRVERDTPTGDLPMAEALLRHSPDALVLVDDGGCIRQVSDEATRMLGYELDELIGVGVEQLVPEAERGVHRAHRTRYRVAPRRRPMGAALDLTARHKDGSAIPVEIALSPIDLDGRLWVMAALRDVSARVESERQQQLIRRAIEATREAVFIFSQADLRFVYVNQGALDQAGYDQDELLGGMTPLHIEPEFTESDFRDLLQPLVDGELQSRTLVTTHRRKDGTDVPVEVTIELPQLDDLDPGGEVFVALARDVSGRLERERRDRSREADFRAAFEHHLVPTAIVSTLGERIGSILEVNERFIALLGQRAEVLRGRSLRDMVVPADVPVIDALLDPATTTPGSAIEARLRTAGGGQVWVEMGASPMEDPTDPDRVVVQFQDVTARVEAASERDRHRRALSTLADRERIARDLHDMVIQRLFAAGMGLQAVMPLAEHGLLDQRLNETVDTLDETIAALRSTIFELSNPELERTLLERVTRVVQLKTEPFSVTADISVDVDEPPPDHVVESLLATLGEALANVGRHSEADAVIVAVTTENDHLVLRVEDDGVGMHPDAPRGNGIDNMMWRASDLGGRCLVEPGENRGTQLHWEVPVEPTADGDDQLVR
jgi:PAS domain S-box-containing protein